MARLHVTASGEALDLICFREYGTLVGTVEQVLKANPEIRKLVHRLPAGTEVNLPDLSAVSGGAARARLWD